MRKLLSMLALAAAITACGQPAATPNEAQAQTGAAQMGEVDAAERNGILRVLQLSADAQGQVENECGDKVTPQFLPADLGAPMGRAVLFAIGGGPTMAACYGDGPDLHLMRRVDGGWREIYSARGRMLIILPSAHDGVHDLADGGPGFSFPVWQWNGTAYAFANREVSDAQIADARFLP